MINAYIWITLYVVFELMTYWCTYTMVLNIRSTPRLWRYIVFLLISIGVTLGVYDISSDLLNVLIMPVVLGVGIPVLLLHKCKKTYFFSYFLIIFIVAIFSELINLLMYDAVGTALIDTKQLSLWSLFSKFIIIILCFIVKIIRLFIQKPLLNLKFTRIQYITFLIGLICCAIFIACGELFMWNGDINRIGQSVLAWAGVLLCVVFMVISLIQGMLISKNSEYKEEQLQYEYFLKLQEQHIYSLIKKDLELAKFRHDIQAHMTALKAIADSSDNKELSDYLNQMFTQSAVFAQFKYTDNVSVNAIICEMHQVMIKNEIEFDYSCDVNLPKDINTYDLCSIIYNILKNAIEACQSVDIAPKNICLTMINVSDKLYITITNPCNIDVNCDDITSLSTTKKDKTKHGIGTQNTKDAVHSNGGVIKYSVQNRIFRTDIII